MKKEMRIHKLNRREALIGLTGIAAATPLLAGQGSVKPPKSAAKELAARPMAVNERDNPFDQDWLFHRGDISGAENPAFDDSRWRRLDLPHDWSIEDLTPVEEATGQGTVWVQANVPTEIGPFSVTKSAGEEATGWVVGGTGWYRKRFHLPSSVAKSECEIRFDGVYMNADVWLNGHLLGFHPYGYTTFAYNLTPFLNPTGENMLAVRVRNEGQNSRWYSGSGIYRHVWLTFTEKLRIPLWGVGVTTPKVAPDAATVEVAVKVENRAGSASQASLMVNILGPHGELAASEVQNLDLPASGEAVAALARSRITQTLVECHSAALPRRGSTSIGRKSC